MEKQKEQKYSKRIKTLNLICLKNRFLKQLRLILAKWFKKIQFLIIKKKNGLMPRVIITLFLFMKCSALAVSLCNGYLLYTLCVLGWFFINEIIIYQKKKRFNF